MKQRDTHTLLKYQTQPGLYLKIKTEGLKRTFYYSFDGENYTEVYVAENIYYLCSEAISKGKRFTGAMIGMYAYSGEESVIYAPFDSFECIAEKYAK